MAYKLLYTKTAAKDIKSLDMVAKKRLRKKIDEYIRNPLDRAKRLTDPRIGEYRWRIGNYGVIFDVKRDILIILRVGHRKEIYR